MIVVADTSPINYLVLIGQIHLLPHFYEQVLAPPAVWDEFHHRETPEPLRTWIAATPKWFKLCGLAARPDPALDFLGQGEREAIALAQEVKADRLIVDELPARVEAIRRSLRVVGTLGILRNGARANLLSLPEELSKLQRAGFYASPELIRSILEGRGARRD